MTDTVTSADGTRIAYDRMGQGPTLVLALWAVAAGLDVPRLAVLEPPVDTSDNYDEQRAFTAELAAMADAVAAAPPPPRSSLRCCASSSYGDLRGPATCPRPFSLR